jgi:hypothetical protein
VRGPAEQSLCDRTVVLIVAVVVLGLVAWFDSRCLADLAQTSDRELHYFNRNAWALIIVLSFPIGPMLYLFYAKGPRRYI